MGISTSEQPVSSPERPLRVRPDSPSVAVIGAGHWGKNLVRNFSELDALGVICDCNADSLSGMATRYPDIRRTTDYGSVLANPSVDAVVVATPAATHGGIVREALLNGKDVLVEKPLCLDEGEGRELVALAEERGRILMVGHLLWYHPAIRKLRTMMRSGVLGRIRYIYSNRLNLGKLRVEENVLWSFAPHDISVILGLLDEMPESVHASGKSFLSHEVSDTTMSRLSFPGGSEAHIFVSWLHPFKEQKLVVVGSRQMAVFEDTLPWEQKLRLYPHSIDWREAVPLARKAEHEDIGIEPAEPLREECRHFLDCIETRRTPRTDGREALRVLAVLNACQQAMKLDAAVRIHTDGKGSSAAFFAHASASVEGDATVGDGTRIWNFSRVLQGSRVGANCSIGQNVVIGPNVTVGDGCKIQNNVSVYEGVTLEDDVFCGPGMVFTNVSTPRAAVSRQHAYERTLVRKGCTIGANATIVCGNTLGRYAFIGAGAVVTHDVPDHALVTGNPARRAGWMCECGERLDDALHCGTCGKAYRTNGHGLEPVA